MQTGCCATWGWCRWGVASPVHWAPPTRPAPGSAPVAAADDPGSGCPQRRAGSQALTHRAASHQLRPTPLGWGQSGCWWAWPGPRLHPQQLQRLTAAGAAARLYAQGCPSGRWWTLAQTAGAVLVSPRGQHLTTGKALQVPKFLAETACSAEMQHCCCRQSNLQAVSC